MTDIARRDAPWLWGFHPKQFSLFHAWFHNVKLNSMANNTLKYKRIDPALRSASRHDWNHPVLWPLVILLLVVVVSMVPALITYRRKLRARALQAGEAV